jgi:hypothetical protein
MWTQAASSSAAHNSPLLEQARNPVACVMQGRRVFQVLLSSARNDHIESGEIRSIAEDRIDCVQRQNTYESGANQLHNYKTYMIYLGDW